MPTANPAFVDVDQRTGEMGSLIKFDDGDDLRFDAGEIGGGGAAGRW